MSKNQQTPNPAGAAEAVARGFFGVTDDPASIGKAVRRSLIGAAASLVLFPAIFFLRVGKVDSFAWGVTAFFTVYNLLAAVGLYFLRRPEYHSPVAMRGDLRDRAGAFWLVACVFGPFLGWAVTSALPISLADWRWLYGLRAFLAGLLPVATALALLRYARGRGALIMLAMLILVTALPVWSAWATCQDLISGPVAVQTQDQPQPEGSLYLSHTRQVLRP